MPLPSAPTAALEIAPGVVALPPGLLWLPAARALLAADAHLGYEDVVGATLPLWSTAETLDVLARTAQRCDVEEIVFLGDVIHGTHMSAGAASAVTAALDVLRERWLLTLVAGNHEGRSRGVAILGATVERCERAGWLLVHGDRPAAGTASIAGHLHPSLHLGGAQSAPAFVASARLIVVPALTPYSSGLNVLSPAWKEAVGPWGVQAHEQTVIAATSDVLYPFGQLSALRDALNAPYPLGANRFRRRLRTDGR